MKLWAPFAVGVLVAGLSGAALALDKPGLDAVRDKAVAVIDEKGLKDGATFLGNPANGFLDLQGPGLHTWAVSRNGIIAFDHSGQTQPDMDISTLTTVDGQSVTAKTFSYADRPEGGGYDDASWPHPVTGAMGTAYVTCRTPKTNPDLAVCAMAWLD
ncbi:hypothetical protein [Pararhodospirillum oryzae]|uniref:Single Cache domain-containing protein n=1 Tax=Pararhodospirillum oryzae TaxID=478448 RepID=A0A512H8G3_9PROT|nr:hypothetical protein [Pararhodospirillum oryzae]GEO81737.1 hypothetical protein ROR02_18680 [Pararhodospirillum oryzae]